MNRATSVSRRDSSLDHLVKLVNQIAVLACWASVIFSIFYIIVTNNLVIGIVLAFITPVRYFLFDIENSKLTKRPPSLDRSIPLTIFVNYWNKTFPIPQGNIIADLVGFLLASLRAFFNGFGLLYFDTFTFFFKERESILLDEDEVFLHSNKKLEELRLELDEASSEEDKARLEEALSNWRKSKYSSDLDVWNFPIKRYMTTPKDAYFKAQEIGANLLDDRFMLDLNKYLEAHPEEASKYNSVKKEQSDHNEEKDES